MDRAEGGSEGGRQQVEALPLQPQTGLAGFPLMPTRTTGTTQPQSARPVCWKHVRLLSLGDVQ
jgi:hypothetical protein